MSTDDYGDDRYGMMRVHIADRRADLACQRYTRANLRMHANRHGLTAKLKRDLAWFMAQHGLIDADGYLRDGFPAGERDPGCRACERSVEVF